MSTHDDMAHNAIVTAYETGTVDRVTAMHLMSLWLADGTEYPPTDIVDAVVELTGRQRTILPSGGVRQENAAWCRASLKRWAEQVTA